MKQTHFYYTLALSILCLLSCSEGEYSYYDSTEPYYPYDHTQPPARTLTGKLIFDYTFDAFVYVPELLNQVMKLELCLSAPPSDSAAFFRRYFYGYDMTSAGNLWKISRQEQMTIIDTGGKLLDEPSADWNVYCNIAGLYIMRNSCRITYSNSGSVKIRITRGRFGDRFNGSAEFTVEKRDNELSIATPLLFDLRGSGSLQSIINPDFCIEYATEDFIRQNDRFFDGVMNIVSSDGTAAPDTVSAALSADNRVAITYKNYTDEWIYTNYDRF